MYKKDIKDSIKKKLEEKQQLHSQSYSSFITDTLMSLIGKGGISQGPKFNPTTSIDRVESYCVETRAILERERKAYLKNIEAHRKEQEALIQKQMEEIKNSDLTLMDYISGNVPQLGEQGKVEQKE